MNKSSLHDRFGATPIINGVGPATRLGGVPMSDSVWQAMKGSADFRYRMDELHMGAGRYIAQILGIPGALVTSGASAAMTLSAAVCLSGLDPDQIAELPKVRHSRSVIVVQRSNRDPYDHALTAAGAELREIGYPTSTHPIELEFALKDDVCAVLWRPGAPTGTLSLATVAEAAHSRDIPVIVDGAMFVPPVERLRTYFADGADFVAVSGGKGFRGPHSSGLLCASEKHIKLAMLHNLDMDERQTTWEYEIAPDIKALLPRNGVARGMKVAPEQIFGLAAAIEEFLAADAHDLGFAELEACKMALSSNSFVTATLVHHEPLNVTNLHIQVGGEVEADRLYTHLVNSEPRVVLGQELASAGILTVNPMALAPGHGVRIAEQIHKYFLNQLPTREQL